jgi:hypothetical protein
MVVGAFHAQCDHPSRTFVHPPLQDSHPSDSLTLTMDATELLEGLARIATQRQALDLLEQDLVLEARALGCSWRKIAAALGITAEGARWRHRQMET